MEKTPVVNGITSYAHCKSCFEAGRHDKIAVGWTPKGFQIWCDACDTNVMAIDFLGQKVGIDTEPDKSRE